MKEVLLERETGRVKILCYHWTKIKRFNAIFC